MKKKISLVVAVLVLVLGLAGCGNAKTVSYDKDTLIQSCDAVFDIIELMEDVTRYCWMHIPMG